ncbi:MAG: hemerythrin domain-containing protein [Pseudomonadota bacterium]
MQTLSDIKHNNAISLLEADHQVVSVLFKKYEESIDKSDKKDLVNKICKELTIHAQVEEDVFYPQFKQALNDTELVPEATVEHNTLKDLIAQVEGKEPDGEMFDAKIKVMSEYVQHHVKEEEGEMFPKAKKSKMDLEKIGMEIIARKAELLESKKK